MRAALVLCALLALLAPACRDKARGAPPGAIPVGRLTVSWVQLREDGTAVRDERLERALGKLLEGGIREDPRIAPGHPGADPLELAVVATPVLAGDDPSMDDGAHDASGAAEPDTGLVFTLRTTYADGFRISASIATRIEAGDPRDPTLVAKEVVADLIEDLVAQLTLFDAPDDDLVRTIGDPDASPDVRAVAVRIAGERKMKAAVPALVSALDRTDSTEPLMEDLVGALGRIGDQEASPALIRAFGRAEGFQQVAIVQALGSTGGDEARQFLAVVASGHQSPITREQAARALASMDKAGD